MKRTVYLLSVLVAVVLTGCESPAAKWALRKEPIYRAGDLVKVNLYSTGSLTLLDEAEPLRDKHTRDNFTITQEVTKVTPEGSVTKFRQTVKTGNRRVFSTVPKNRKYSVDIALDDISGIVNRNNVIFQADNNTLVSTKTESLDIPQVDLVKQIFSKQMTFWNWPVSEQYLITTSPVKLGEKWKVHKDNLNLWAKTSPHARAFSTWPEDAEFQLVEVSDDIATVQGTVTFNPRNKKSPAPTLNMDIWINTRTGQWISSRITRKFVNEGKLTLDVTGKIETKIAFVPGHGRPSKLPARIVKLGWSQPPTDLNNYQNPKYGLSLNIHPPFERYDTPQKANIVERFLAGSDASLLITSDNLSKPTTMAELTKMVIASLKASRKDYVFTKSTPVTLPGNIPAMLLEGKITESKADVITIFAADKGRVINVTAAIPENKPSIKKAATDTVKSLRVFKPGTKK